MSTNRERMMGPPAAPSRLVIVPTATNSAPRPTSRPAEITSPAFDSSRRASSEQPVTTQRPFTIPTRCSSEQPNTVKQEQVDVFAHNRPNKRESSEAPSDLSEASSTSTTGSLAKRMTVLSLHDRRHSRRSSVSRSRSSSATPSEASAATASTLRQGSPIGSVRSEGSTRSTGSTRSAASSRGRTGHRRQSRAPSSTPGMAILEEQDEEMDEICSSTAAQSPESIVISSDEEAPPPLQPQLPPSRTVRWNISIRYEDSSLGTKTFDYVNPFTEAMMDDVVADRVKEELPIALGRLVLAQNQRRAREVGGTRS